MFGPLKSNSAPRSKSDERMPALLWWILCGFALLRFLISFRVGLGVDEAHYALYGLHLDWSYFDHPPLVGWVQAVFAAMLGAHDWVFRLPANVCGLLSSYLLYRIVIRMTKPAEFKSQAAFWAVVALNVAFMPVGLFIMLLPDTLLLPLSLWLVLIVSDFQQKQKNQRDNTPGDQSATNPSSLPWIQLGFCLGLCGLTKYTSAIFVISLLGIAFTEKLWRVWLSRYLFFSIAIAMGCIVPVLYWNQLHDWISFSYQSGHVLGQKHFEWSSFAQSLAAQFVAYSPFLVAISVVGMLFNKNKYNEVARIGLWLALPCFLFFAYSGFTNFVLPHWTLVVYVLFLAIGTGTSFSRPRFRQVFKLCVILTAIIALTLQLELLFQVVPFGDYQSPYTDLTGWPELRQDLLDYQKANPQEKFDVGISNWSLGSRAFYYFKDVAQVFVLDDRFDQFDIWEAGKKPTGDIMLLAWHDFHFEQALDQMCASHETVKARIFSGRSYIITSAEWILCRAKPGASSAK